MKLSDFVAELEEYAEDNIGTDPEIFFSLNGKKIRHKDFDIEPDEHPGILVRFE